MLEEERVDGAQHLPGHIGEAVGARAPGLEGRAIHSFIPKWYDDTIGQGGGGSMGTFQKRKM